VSGYANVVSTLDPRLVAGIYQQHRFDLIVLDLNMPYMDGFDVMRQLRALDPEKLPPILILTAQHAQEHRVRALQAGARDYVTKPFEKDELLARVRNLLEIQLYHKSMRGRNRWLESGCGNAPARSCMKPACRSFGAWGGPRNSATTKPACTSCA